MMARRRHLVCLAALLLAGCTQEQQEARGRTEQWQTFNATAYSVEGETASGAQTREGRTIAADTRILPMGAKVEVADAGPYSGVYVVHDRGRAIRGREIDIFIDNPREAKAFGKKPVRIRVLELPAAREKEAR